MENNLKDELLINEEVVTDENIINNEVVDVINQEEVLEDDSTIENLENTTVFTPVVSDGILEEILELDDNKNDNLIICDNDNIDEPLNINIDEINDVSIVESDEENNYLDNVIEESNYLDNDSQIIETVDSNILNNTTETEESMDSINIADDLDSEQNDEEDFVNLKIEENESVVPNNDNIIENKKEDTLLDKYGENLSIKEYVCNPAIGRDNEIKQLILTLLTPEKSGILVGKPGIGKTAIVEGLGYQIQKGNVPDALKEYQIYKLNTSSLLGIMPGTNEPKIQVLLNEIKGQTKLILFIDEIHTLIGAGAEGDDSLDFANIFKPGLDRGNIKIIGATTTDEYDRYILTDKAFVRRFQKIDVLEPTKEHTVKILMGSLPKLEHKTAAKLKYTPFIQEKIMTFIVDLTTEYRRVYELSARYPDVALTILQQAFSYAVFDNKKEVDIRDVRKAIANTKLVYSDVVKKELVRFNEVFSDIYLMETPQRLKGETSI